MLAGGFIWHLVRTLRRSFGRVGLWFLVTGLIAAVTVELVDIFETGFQAPTGLTHLIAVVIGIVVGYAASATVFIFEIIRDLVVTVEEIEHAAIKDLRSGEALVDGLVDGLTGNLISSAADRIPGRR